MQEDGKAETNKPKRKIVFTITNSLTGIKSKSIKKPKVEVKAPKKRRLSPLELKYNNEPILGEMSNIPPERGSILNFLNSCHPEVRTFIDNNEIALVRADASKLVIKTRTNFWVTISCVSNYSKRIIVKEGRKVIINAISTSRLEKNPNN